MPNKPPINVHDSNYELECVKDRLCDILGINKNSSWDAIFEEVRIVHDTASEYPDEE